MLHFRAFSLASVSPAIVLNLVVLLRVAVHRAPLILNASFGVFFIHFFYPGPSFSCDFGLFSVS